MVIEIEFCLLIEVFDAVRKSLVGILLKMHINYLTFITLPCELLLSEEGFGFLKSSFYVPDAELFW